MLGLLVEGEEEVCVCGGGADVGNNAVDEEQGAVVLGRGRGGGWGGGGGGADVGNHAVDEEQGARVVGGGGRGGVCVCVCGGGG